MNKMTSNDKEKLGKILEKAKRSPKGDYPTYEQLKQELGLLIMEDVEYRKAVVKLARVLKV